MAITRTQQAKQLLNKVAPKGEKLAYINDKEAKLLKKMGGSGKMTPQGIKSYSYGEDMDASYSSYTDTPGDGGRNTGGGGDGGSDYDYNYARSVQVAIDSAARRQEAEAKAKEEQDIRDAIQSRTLQTKPNFISNFVNTSPTIRTVKTIGKGIKNIPTFIKNERNLIKARSEEEDPTGLYAEGLTRGKPTFTTPESDGDSTPIFYPRISVDPITADTAASTTADQSDPFTAQFTRAALTDADRARINQIGGLSVFAANGGRIGYDMGGEVMDQELQAGAPNLKIEGNQVPQEQQLASTPNIDAELYQLFLDALRKGDVPPGTTFDSYKQLMMQMMSQQEGGQMQEEMQPEREMAAFGGIMGLDGRKRYGFGSIFKKAARAVKKIVKSPIGKAALIAGGAYLLGGSSFLGGQGMFAKGQGLSRFSNLKNLVNIGKLNADKMTTAFGKDAMMGDPAQYFSSGGEKTSLLSKALGYAKKNPFPTIVGLSGLAGLYTAKTQEDEESLDDLIGRSARGPSLDPVAIRRYIAENMGNIDPNQYAYLQPASYADGGRIGAQEGGMMNLGGKEMDLRGGGFVPIGAKEKADDVPARLSKNEFVFTADAVRAAGGGSVDKGAEKMYNTMKQLEGVVA